MALLVLMIACLSALAHAQSNYGSQANNIEYQGDGLPEQTVLDGKVTKLDDLSPVIFLNRTKATLNCEAGSMQIELKFNEKFYGIAYADFDRHSACQVSGKGATSYKLELPLKGCGTKQDPLRVFTNNIVVRFHPGLEMDGDEVITIVCRYPPPIVPVFKPLIYTPEAKGPLPAKAPLAGTHILLIICAILFLTLLLLGLGVSYLCLNRRTLPAPRRLIDDSSASIISRESIQEVKIPRAHPVYPAAAESASVASDTLPSDYPSETPSEADHAHANQAFMIDDYQSEGYGESHETSLTHSRLTGAAPPAFDVRVRVQRPPAPPSPVSTITTTEVDGGSIRQQTLVEEHERQESVRTVSPGALPLPARAVHASPPERPPRPPALYTEVHRERQKPPPPPPVMTERLETEEQEMLMESLEPIPETPIMPARKPEITSHVVDDVFLRTITEKKTIEDIERHKRLVTEYRQVPHVPQFDVTIRNHTQPEAQWENFSDISSASGMTLTPKMERVPLSLPPQKFIGKGGPDLFSPELIKQTDAVYSPSSPDLPLLPELPPARNPLYREEDDEDVPEPIPSPPVPQNWSVLTRVLKTEAQDEVLSESERVHRLTREERLRWRELITHESTLRRELASSSSRDDFTRVSRDHRYAPLYTPPKWEVIIRILAPPPDKPKNRYRKKSEWESRSRRSSLPTLYEYDSDATSLREPQRSRRSSYRSDHVDMRSMSEMMVDYAREQADTHSEVSAGTLLGRYYDDDSDSEHHYNQHPSWRNSLHRSVSQPSLARSATELTERWTAPDGDVTPTPPRRNRGLIGGQGMTAFTSSEVRTFQASREWRE
ncbi:uncharacterized protein LOC116779753 isoform X3 [Danaus plexippus]|uniref:uncharacterized protein LOC116779753 isoform X3 n=1 Tax=Danaus plexippus TaxID=13037 RepID=UPI002AB12497|nr:uncharacterized protein LOC116779753 isoform X3 [Danaus plexippus]